MVCMLFAQDNFKNANSRLQNEIIAMIISEAKARDGLLPEENCMNRSTIVNTVSQKRAPTWKGKPYAHN